VVISSGAIERRRRVDARGNRHTERDVVNDVGRRIGERGIHARHRCGNGDDISGGGRSSTPATFAVQAHVGSAAIAIVSGTGQSGRLGQALGAPFVVRVTDDVGNAVSGATVSWTAVNGTIQGRRRLMWGT
jgi:hypothetical protein